MDAVNAIPLFGHPPARSVRWWMFDVLVTVLAALLSLPDLAQEHVTPTLSAVLVHGGRPFLCDQRRAPLAGFQRGPYPQQRVPPTPSPGLLPAGSPPPRA